jgi:restriction endonuclease
MATKEKNVYKIKTEKRNKIVVEEINPNELKEIWKKLNKLNKTL